MRLISRFMLAGALTLSVSVLGCESSKSDDKGTTDATDAADAADSSTAADATDTTDGVTEAGDSDATDAVESADATDATEGTESADAPDATDAVDGTESADAPDATDAVDGTESADAPDATDAVDGTESADAPDATDATDGVDATDAVDGGGENLACQDPPVFGTPKTHVVSIKLPSGNFNCDSNNDNTTDAKDGNLNEVLGNPALASLFNVNELLATNISEGDIVLLGDLNGTWTDGGGTDLFLNLFLGTKLGAEPVCQDWEVTKENAKGEAAETTWDGKTACDFEIDTKSFGADGCPVVQITGATVAGGTIDAGPVDFNFTLPLGTLTLDVGIGHGRFQGDLTDAFRVTDGVLCGEIPYDKLSAAFDKVCTDDPSQTLCTYKSIALTLIKQKCNQGGTQCSIVVQLETAVATSFSIAEPE